MADKILSIKKDNKLDKLQDWAAAAAEAKKKLAEMKCYAAQLRASLRIFEEKIRTGAPYP